MLQTFPVGVTHENPANKMSFLIPVIFTLHVTGSPIYTEIAFENLSRSRERDEMEGGRPHGAETYTEKQILLLGPREYTQDREELIRLLQTPNCKGKKHILMYTR